MGRVFSAMKRELKNYNVENRAHKMISKDKLPPAPLYKSVIEDIERMKEQGITVEEMSKKHAQLNENLKHIHVKSTGPAPDSSDSRPLPIDRISYLMDKEYGYLEPESVSPGKITLKNLLELVSLYQSDKKKYGPETLAMQYNLDKKFVEIVVDRLQVLQLYMPKDLDKQVKDPLSRLEIRKTIANLKKLTLTPTIHPKEEEPTKNALTK